MGILTQLALADFRNYETLDLAFAPGVNVLIGENGQGKSNLLEAIYFLSLLRSFRTTRIDHLQRWRQGRFLVRGTLEDDGRRRSIGVEQGEKRRLRIDGETISRASDFIGHLVCVAFVPEDIELVKGPAADRRRHLDITLSQIQPGYMAHLQDYHKALKSRNSLLRQERPDLQAVAAYDMVLVRTGAEVLAARYGFFASFGSILAAHGRDLFPEERRLAIKYQPNVTTTLAETGAESEGGAIPAVDVSDEVADRKRPSTTVCRLALQSALAANLERDLARGMTHAGPHRDDFTLSLQGRGLASYGSEGQCRLAALALKMATADVLFENRGREHVVLLVDDVIGELDDARRTAFFGRLGEAAQVFLACTSETVLTGITAARRFSVADATVTPLVGT